MKGSSEIILTGITTMGLIIILAVVLIIATGLYVRFVIFGGGPLSQEFETVSSMSNPYSLGAILTHKKIDNRNLLEHNIETLVTGDMTRSDSENVPANLKDFLDGYDFEFYHVSLEKQVNGKNEKTLFSIDNAKRICADSAGKKGYCNQRLIFPSKVEECNIGRIKISGNCPWREICCAENATNGHYEPKTKKGLDIVQCGSNHEGVCSADGNKPYIAIFIPKLIAVLPLYKSVGCGNGRVRIVSDECKSANKGQTPVCCAPISESFYEKTAIGTKMIIPLLYRNNTNWPKGMLSYMVVFVNER